MIRMLWMGGWHCALTQQPPSKISIQFLLTKKATSFSPLDSFFPELRLLSSSFFSPPSFLMSWLFDKISAAVAGCCFCFATSAAAQRGKKAAPSPTHRARPFFQRTPSCCCCVGREVREGKGVEGRRLIFIKLQKHQQSLSVLSAFLAHCNPLRTKK